MSPRYRDLTMPLSERLRLSDRYQGSKRKCYHERQGDAEGAAHPVLHPIEPGLDQGGELGEIAFGQGWRGIVSDATGAVTTTSELAERSCLPIPRR
jgi:hypothetical protein